MSTHGTNGGHYLFIVSDNVLYEDHLVYTERFCVPMNDIPAQVMRHVQQLEEVEKYEADDPLFLFDDDRTPDKIKPSLCCVREYFQHRTYGEEAFPETATKGYVYKMTSGNLPDRTVKMMHIHYHSC